MTMPKHLIAQGSLAVALPIGQCQMLFTPAGEELWIDEWRPAYHHPADGRTEAGMVFATGTDDDCTLWLLVDFERGVHPHERHYARYARVTPALRSGFVEVRCEALTPRSTRVDVRYAMTALTPAGEASLQAYEPEPFAAMLAQWQRMIEARLPALAAADIR